MTAWLWILAAVIVTASYFFLTPYQAVIFGVALAVGLVGGWLA